MDRFHHSFALSFIRIAFSFIASFSQSSFGSFSSFFLCFMDQDLGSLSLDHSFWTSSSLFHMDRLSFYRCASFGSAHLFLSSLHIFLVFFLCCAPSRISSHGSHSLGSRIASSRVCAHCTGSSFLAVRLHSVFMVHSFGSLSLDHCALRFTLAVWFLARCALSARIVFSHPLCLVAAHSSHLWMRPPLSRIAGCTRRMDQDRGWFTFAYARSHSALLVALTFFFFADLCWIWISPLRSLTGSHWMRFLATLRLHRLRLPRSRGSLTRIVPHVYVRIAITLAAFGSRLSFLVCVCVFSSRIVAGSFSSYSRSFCATLDHAHGSRPAFAFSFSFCMVFSGSVHASSLSCTLDHNADLFSCMVHFIALAFLRLRTDRTLRLHTTRAFCVHIVFTARSSRLSLDPAHSRICGLLRWIFTLTWILAFSHRFLITHCAHIAFSLPLCCLTVTLPRPRTFAIAVHAGSSVHTSVCGLHLCARLLFLLRMRTAWFAHIASLHSHWIVTSLARTHRSLCRTPVSVFFTFLFASRIWIVHFSSFGSSFVTLDHSRVSGSARSVWISGSLWIMDRSASLLNMDVFVLRVCTLSLHSHSHTRALTHFIFFFFLDGFVVRFLDLSLDLLHLAFTFAYAWIAGSLWFTSRLRGSHSFTLDHLTFTSFSFHCALALPHFGCLCCAWFVTSRVRITLDRSFSPGSAVFHVFCGSRVCLDLPRFHFTRGSLTHVFCVLWFTLTGSAVRIVSCTWFSFVFRFLAFGSRLHSHAHCRLVFTSFTHRLPLCTRAHAHSFHSSLSRFLHSRLSFLHLDRSRFGITLFCYHHGCVLARIISLYSFWFTLFSLDRSCFIRVCALCVTHHAVAFAFSSLRARILVAPRLDPRLDARAFCTLPAHLVHVFPLFAFMVRT